MSEKRCHGETYQGRSRRKSASGFTILEVALALAILALALVALSTLQARNLTLVSEESLLTEGVLAARDFMARILAKALPLEIGEGEMGEGHPGWRWAMAVEQAEDSHLARIEVRLLKEGQEPQRAISFWFLVFRKEQR